MVRVRLPAHPSRLARRPVRAYAGCDSLIRPIDSPVNLARARLPAIPMEKRRLRGNRNKAIGLVSRVSKGVNKVSAADRGNAVSRARASKVSREKANRDSKAKDSKDNKKENRDRVKASRDSKARANKGSKVGRDRDSKARVNKDSRDSKARVNKGSKDSRDSS